MTPTQVSIRGILKADGTLELSERPSLPEGPVEVVIKVVQAREVSPADREGLMEFIQRLRTEREAAGGRFLTKEEIDAEIAEMRDGGEDRLEEIYREIEAGRKRPEVAEDWWQYLQRARAELEAEGGHFRTGEEIDAEIAEMRDWGEDRIEAAWQGNDPC